MTTRAAPVHLSSFLGPRGLARGLAGGLSRQDLHVMDLMPTLLEAVGADPRAPEGMLPFEGPVISTPVAGPPGKVATTPGGLLGS